MTIPSQQTRFPRFLADSERGDTCFDPKLRENVLDLVCYSCRVIYVRMIEQKIKQLSKGFWKNMNIKLMFQTQQVSTLVLG